MRNYVMVTGLLFGLIVAAHVARLVAEGAGSLRDPLFVMTTLLSTAIALWSLSLLRLHPSRGSRRP